ncbi:Ribosomal protein L30 [Burkholderia cenocepacia PC184]|nr:Ribosomal protein L30 [Burkholderia cenocepacia PC184]
MVTMSEKTCQGSARREPDLDPPITPRDRAWPVPAPTPFNIRAAGHAGGPRHDQQSLVAR